LREASVLDCAEDERMKLAGRAAREVWESAVGESRGGCQRGNELTAIHVVLAEWSSCVGSSAYVIVGVARK
jgi:hypothetical protein